MNPSENAAERLPELVVTTGGDTLYPWQDVWILRDEGDRRSLNFARLQGLCSDQNIMGVRLMCTHLARNYSPGWCINFLEYYLRMAKYLRVANGRPLDTLTSADVMSYRGSLAAHRQYHLGSIRRALRTWVALKFPGVAGDVPDTLRRMKLIRNTSGRAVLTMCTRRGPFTENELKDISKAVRDHYARGAISLRHFGLVHLLMAFGARPVQFAALKLKDFETRQGKNGIEEFTLRIPRAKQAYQKRRHSFKGRKLTREFGKMLTGLALEVKQRFAEEIAAGHDSRELPFFPASRPEVEYGFHSYSDALGQEVTSLFSVIKIPSERTGGAPMRITPQRFRHTVGTRAAEERKSRAQIAEILDHSSLKSCDAYIELSSEILQNIDGAISLSLLPLAQTFMGVIVEHESQAERGEDPASRVRFFEGDCKGSPVGTCGKYGFCGGFVPIACYTCRNFQPWLEAPHEEVLFFLVAERKRQFDVTQDARLATVNDRTIQAVAAVVQRCREIKSQRRTLE